MLTGGHPNSLGRTEEVVASVLKDQSRFKELFACYQSADEVVRLRTSSAMKRVEKAKPHLLVPYIDRFLDEIAALQQASAQWTLAQLFLALEDKMSLEQQEKATKLLKKNLKTNSDWIVLNCTMETLAAWAISDPKLKRWLKPQLERLATDERKSVASRAKKKQKLLAK